MDLSLKSINFLESFPVEVVETLLLQLVMIFKKIKTNSCGLQINLNFAGRSIFLLSHSIWPQRTNTLLRSTKSKYISSEKRLENLLLQSETICPYSHYCWLMASCSSVIPPVAFVSFALDCTQKCMFFPTYFQWNDGWIIQSKMFMHGMMCWPPS